MVEKANILVVDDDSSVCGSCQRILTEQGYKVDTAMNMSEAFKKIEQDAFDVILLDLEIPNGGILGMISKIKESWPKAKVVVTTIYPSIEIAKNVIKRGAFDYLPKPISFATITEIIAKAVKYKGWALYVNKV